VLGVVYTYVLTPMKRKEAPRRTLTAPDTNEHGVDLQNDIECCGSRSLLMAVFAILFAAPLLFLLTQMG
jgi:hypothetical protein